MQLGNQLSLHKEQLRIATPKRTKFLSGTGLSSTGTVNASRTWTVWVQWSQQSMDRSTSSNKTRAAAGRAAEDLQHSVSHTSSKQDLRDMEITMT